MTVPGMLDGELANAIAALYGGPLENFVGRRAALAKELRAAGRHEPASVVKELRKPSRIAWALDQAVLGDRDAIDRLDAALADTLAAHAGTGDVREAIAGLRAAVREFAARAARAAEGAGFRIEPGATANAVLAVLGTPDSFDRLRRGCLTDIPEAGGLDFLSAVPASPVQIERPSPAEVSPPAVARASFAARADLKAEKRDAVRRAELALAKARERSEAAQRSLHDAESKLSAAETRLREAEAEARALRGQVDRARQKAETSAAELTEAERAVADTKRRNGAPRRDLSVGPGDRS